MLKIIQRFVITATGILSPNFLLVANKSKEVKAMNKLVSIIIPTYNGEKYLAETIQSIKKQNIPHEIIVIDDVSSDKSVEIAKDMGVKVLVNSVRKGQVAGKNIGIRAATGEYWLTIDQDDILRPYSLQRLLTEMEDSSKDISIVMAKLKDFCSPDTPNQIRFVKKEPYYGILTGTTLFRKSIFDTIGLFREDIITGDVIDLTHRLSQYNKKIKKIDFISCDRRIHNSNYGITNQKNEYKDYAKILRDKLRGNSNNTK